MILCCSLQLLPLRSKSNKSTRTSQRNRDNEGGLNTVYVRSENDWHLFSGKHSANICRACSNDTGRADGSIGVE